MRSPFRFPRWPPPGSPLLQPDADLDLCRPIPCSPWNGSGPRPYRPGLVCQVLWWFDVLFAPPMAAGGAILAIGGIALGELALALFGAFIALFATIVFVGAWRLIHLGVWTGPDRGRDPNPDAPAQCFPWSAVSRALRGSTGRVGPAFDPAGVTGGDSRPREPAHCPQSPACGDGRHSRGAASGQLASSTNWRVAAPALSPRLELSPSGRPTLGRGDGLPMPRSCCGRGGNWG